MSVVPNEIVTYGSANMPEADGVTIGGAVDFTKRVAWYDLSANDTIDAVSSSASDTATNVQVFARNAGGATVTSSVATLTGQTPITNVGSLGTVERLLAAVTTGGAIAGLTSPGGTTAVGDVAIYRHTATISAHTARAGSANTSGSTPPTFALQAGDGAGVALGQIIRITSGTGANQLRQIVATSGYGTDFVAVSRDWSVIPDATSVYSVYQGMLFEVTPNQVLAITRCFATAAADVPGGSNRTFYEKVFSVNNDTATDLTSAQGEILSETPTLPSGVLLDLGPTSGLNDTATIANRQTAPGGISFTTQPALINVPGGALPHGAAPNAAGAQGWWMRLTVPAGSPPYKGSALLRVIGATT